MKLNGIAGSLLVMLVINLCCLEIGAFVLYYPFEDDEARDCDDDITIDTNPITTNDWFDHIGNERMGNAFVDIDDEVMTRSEEGRRLEFKDFVDTTDGNFNFNDLLGTFPELANFGWNQYEEEFSPQQRKGQQLTSDNVINDNYENHIYEQDQGTNDNDIKTFLEPAIIEWDQDEEELSIHQQKGQELPTDNVINENYKDQNYGQDQGINKNDIKMTIQVTIQDALQDVEGFVNYLDEMMKTVQIDPPQPQQAYQPVEDLTYGEDADTPWISMQEFLE